DPRFIVRRMVILASEDIGNADPAALSVATAAAQAVEHVGLPEARFALAQAAIYLALAPKSDAAGRALSAAERHVREHGAAEVLGSVEATPREQIADVVAAVAMVQPLWALLRVKDRARYMRRMAQAVIDDFDELLGVLVREQGRPAGEVAALELLPAIDALLW